MTAEDVATVDDWVKPLPAPDGVSAPFWRGAAEGRLLIQRCPACGRRQFYPRAWCTACGADPEWMEASGRGTVHTFTIVRQHGQRGFTEELPYVVAIIELEEGPRMMGNVGGIAPEDVHIGLPVKVAFTRVDDEIGIPNWTAAAETA